MSSIIISSYQPSDEEECARQGFRELSSRAAHRFVIGLNSFLSRSRLRDESCRRIVHGSLRPLATTNRMR